MTKALLASLLLATPVYAFDTGQYENIDPNIRAWFKSVRSPHGIPCCDIADGHATAWRKSQIEGFEYEVPIEGKWYPVPEEAIVRDSKNPTGETIVWYIPWPPANNYYIRCFVLGSGV